MTKVDLVKATLILIPHNIKEKFFATSYCQKITALSIEIGNIQYAKTTCVKIKLLRI